MTRFLSSAGTVLKWLRHPRSQPFWQWLALISAAVSILLTVQQFFGLPFSTTLPVGPANRIEVQRAQNGCYRWRPPPRFRSQAVEYRAVILENGKPLSRCEHTGEVEQIKASHFQVHDSIFRFGTGDGSDVRSNGRRYEARLPMPVRPEWFAITFGLLALSISMVLRGATPGWWLTLPSLPDRLPVWGVGLAALALATISLVMHHDQSQGALLVKGLPESDAAGWHYLAERLSEGQGLDINFGAQRPFYAILLGAAMMFFGHSLLVAKALNVLVVSLAAIGIFSLGRVLRCSWAGLASVAFIVLSADHWNQIHMIVTEPSGMSFGILGACALLWAVSRRSPLGCLIAGLIAGIGNLMCGELLLAVPLNIILLVGLGLLRQIKPERCSALIACFIAGVCAAMLPWMAMQKARFGIFTLSMNSAELLSGGADPVHGKLDYSMHVEANEKGMSIANPIERYHYFSQLFVEDVKTDPFGYIVRVAKASAQSLEFMRVNDPMVRGMLALTILGTGLTCTLRSRSSLPLIISSITVLFLAQIDDPWPAWLLSLPVFSLLFRRWQKRQLLALGLILTTVVACMALCGLAGNVASRRFWIVADWALLLLWLISVTHLLQLIFSSLPRFSASLAGSEAVQPDHKSLPIGRTCLISMLGLLGLSLLALLLIGVRHWQGPHPQFDAKAIAALPTPPVEGNWQTRLVMFDDFSIQLEKWEHIPHWLPYYYPSSEPRWIARPRLVLPDGTLGSRILVEATKHEFPKAPRWQLMQCMGRPTELKDPISGGMIQTLHAVKMLPVTLPAAK